MADLSQGAGPRTLNARRELEGHPCREFHGQTSCVVCRRANRLSSTFLRLASARHMTSPRLTTDEIDELAQFLMSDATPASVMMLDTLHGYLTALAICPGHLPHTPWLSHVWSAEGDELPAFENAQQESRIVSLILRMFEDIQADLDDPDELFEPLVALVRMEDEAFRDGQRWAEGFMEAIAVHRNVWAAFLDSEENQEILEPILRLQGLARSAETGLTQEEAEQRDELTEDVSDAVEDAARWFLEQPFKTITHDDRKGCTQILSSTVTVDTCPCGSGKHFKECCGAPGRLH